MTEKKVTIIDYKLGNLFSVNQALKNIGLNTVISSSPEDVNTADAIVLPGVGAFKDAMNNLQELELANAIKNYVKGGKPFLGICLGLQLLFTESEEFGSTVGLDIVPGRVKRFSNENSIKVPQIAWNTIDPANRGWEGSPLSDIKHGEHMYFVHSYYVEPIDSSIALTKTKYGNTEYVSSIFRTNVFACQFHPEKSAQEGLKIYNKWAAMNNLI